MPKNCVADHWCVLRGDGKSVCSWINPWEENLCWKYPCLRFHRLLALTHCSNDFCNCCRLFDLFGSCICNTSLADVSEQDGRSLWGGNLRLDGDAYSCSGAQCLSSSLVNLWMLANCKVNQQKLIVALERKAERLFAMVARCFFDSVRTLFFVFSIPYYLKSNQ